MKCPVDATDLLITERSGVEIEYRPQCHGGCCTAGGSTSSYTRSFTPGRGQDDYGRERDQHGRTSRRKREGFVGEFFGF